MYRKLPLQQPATALFLLSHFPVLTFPFLAHLSSCILIYLLSLFFPPFLHLFRFLILLFLVSPSPILQVLLLYPSFSLSSLPFFFLLFFSFIRCNFFLMDFTLMHEEIKIPLPETCFSKIWDDSKSPENGTPNEAYINKLGVHVNLCKPLKAQLLLLPQ